MDDQNHGITPTLGARERLGYTDDKGADSKLDDEVSSLLARLGWAVLSMLISTNRLRSRPVNSASTRSS